MWGKKFISFGVLDICPPYTFSSNLQLEILEEKTDDGGSNVPSAVDTFLASVIEAYGMVGEMTSADKQQVSTRSAAVKEKTVQCNHEMVCSSMYTYCP